MSQTTDDRVRWTTADRALLSENSEITETILETTLWKPKRYIPR